MGTITTFPTAPLGYTPANTLAYAQSTVNAAAVTDADTDLQVTFTVPDGRRIRVTMVEPNLSGSVASDGFDVKIMEGATVLQDAPWYVVSGNIAIRTSTVSVVVTPTAGTHTYKGRLTRFTGTGTLQPLRSSVSVAYLLVEDITGQASAVAPASVPVGQLGYAAKTASQTITGASTIITELAVNVVVPAGRTLRIALEMTTVNQNAVVAWSVVEILEDGVSIKDSVGNHGVSGAANAYYTHDTSVVRSPAAGSHTYTVRISAAVYNHFIEYSAVRYPYLVVEDITPTPAPANTAPSSTLAYAEVTASQGSITTAVDLTGLAVTVTVPAGRRLRVKGRALVYSSVDLDVVKLAILEGAGQLQQAGIAVHPANWSAGLEVDVILSPSAGMHTYKLQASRDSGTGTVTMQAQPAYPAYILVEDITGSGISGHTHTELDDSGWVAINSFANAWNFYGGSYGANAYAYAAWRKKAGIVYLRGLIATGTAAAGTVMFTLPVGFRPAAVTRPLYEVTSNDTRAQVSILGSDGTVRAEVGVSNVYVSLNNISFPADS